MTFYPQNDVFSEYLILFLVKTMIYPKHNHANSTFLGEKDTQIWPQKVVNPLRG